MVQTVPGADLIGAAELMIHLPQEIRAVAGGARGRLWLQIKADVTGKPVSVPLSNPIGCNVKWEGQDAHWMPAEACDLV